MPPVDLASMTGRLLGVRSFGPFREGRSFRKPDLTIQAGRMYFYSVVCAEKE